VASLVEIANMLKIDIGELTDFSTIILSLHQVIPAKAGIYEYAALQGLR